MFKQLLSLSLLFASQASSAQELVQLRKTVTQAVPTELASDCKQPIRSFITCNFKEGVIATATFTVPEEYSNGNNKIQLSTAFKNVDAEFSIVINGENLGNLSSQPSQSYSIPGGTAGPVVVQIIANEVGDVQVLNKPEAFASRLDSISLVLDGSRHITALTKTMPRLLKTAAKAARDYQLQVEFLDFFTKTDKELAEIKTSLTGVPAHDYTNDCSKIVDEEGQANPDPFVCQQLRVLNNYLQKKDLSGISEDDKSTALNDLQDATNELETAIKTLKAADAQVEQIWTDALNLSLDAAKNVFPKAEGNAP